MFDVFQAIGGAVSSGADLATIAIAYGLWRIERRLTITEFKIESIIKNSD